MISIHKHFIQKEQRKRKKNIIVYKVYKLPEYLEVAITQYDILLHLMLMFERIKALTHTNLYILFQSM